jgi:peptide/nickel transport system permease protein
MRDYPVVLGCVIFYGGIFILVNLVVDVLYAAIDPRIRY